uniref:Uncharacterized protein n=2 Tax=Aegilops tauschii subsp. strangulata TaxID=200361 RepID=A0A453QV89_AEGTS
LFEALRVSNKKKLSLIESVSPRRPARRSASLLSLPPCLGAAAAIDRPRRRRGLQPPPSPSQVSKTITCPRHATP